MAAQTKKIKGARKSRKAHLLAYKNENKHSKNRKIKLTKHIANHPNDANAQRCMEQYQKLGFPYRRVKPGDKINPPKKKFKPFGCFGYTPLSIRDQLFV